jgi:PAS domain S-box-containing protein
MLRAHIPDDERERLAALRRLCILDTAREEIFDDLAAVAAQVCGTPISLISLVDAHRQWFKAAHGMAVAETPREIAFCAHAILDGDGLFVVADALADERFADNPLVTGDPGVRYYAATVLRTADGFPIGTLCVIDTVPRELSPGQIDALRRLGRQVAAQFELQESLTRMGADTARRDREEHELAASERLYRDLVEHAQGLICSHDMAGRLRMVNDAAVRMLGYRREDMLGRNLREFVPAEQIRAFDEYLDHMQASARFNGLLTLVRRDGQRVVLAYQNFRFQSGTDEYVVGHGIDITERVRTEAMNRRFASALDASPDFVAFADVQGRTIYLNRAGRVMCGLDEAAHVEGAELSTFYSPAAADHVRAGITAALREGSWSGEALLRHHDGSERPMAQLVIAPRDETGRPDFIALMARDVSERQRSDERLLRSEQRFRQVVEQVGDVLFETDAAGCLTFLNPAWTEVTGFQVTDALLRPMLDFVHPDDADAYRLCFLPLLSGAKESCVYHARYLTRDGTVRRIEAHARVLGGGAGTIGTLRDVTRQRELADEITRAHKQALSASVMMSEFLANISHEVRTPLNGVLGLTGALLDTGLSDEQRRHADGIQQSGQSLLRIVNDLLDLSKIEAEGLVIEQIAFDLREALAQAAGPVEVRARRKGLAFQLRVADDLPRAVLGDPGRLRQILVNLADNAVKFTASGTISIDVRTVRTDAGQAHLRVAVSDTGTGIPHDKLASIFEKFKQADSSITRNFGGTGLGLAICRQLTALMHGDIGVDSVEGHGSTFWFTLPLLVAEGEAESARPAGATTVVVRHAHVLLVEDNPTNQTVARLFLEKAGCTVELASNGAEAVAAARLRRYDAIFMDCQMPVLDGYGATQQIRAESRCTDVPIVAMTAHAMAGDRERCLAAGMTDYVSKPIQLDSIMTTLDRVLAAPADPSEPFDAEQVLAIFQDDVQTVVKLAATLAADAGRYAAELAAAAESGNWTEAGRRAHALGGAASNVAARDLCNACHQLEAAVQSGATASAARVVEEIQRESDRLIEALGRWAGRLRDDGEAKAETEERCTS